MEGVDAGIAPGETYGQMKISVKEFEKVGEEDTGLAQGEIYG